MWYAIYHPCGIVVSLESSYLCSVIRSHCEVRLRLDIERALCTRLALTLHSINVFIKTDKIMAKIYVNGDAQEVNLPLNVSELIKQLLVEDPEMVSVQVNEEFAEREDWESIQLKEGDKVDFLYFMGGGAR